MLSNLSSGLLGVILGAILTYLIGEYTRRSERKRGINAFLLAIKTEVLALRQRHYESINSNNAPIIGPYLVEQNYFWVLEGQAALLGVIVDDNLRSSIIRTYIKIKSLIDSFKTNNRLLERYENIYLLSLQEPSTTLEQLKSECWIRLSSYAVQIRALQIEVESDIQQLMELIRQYLESNFFTCFKCGGRKKTALPQLRGHFN